MYEFRWLKKKKKKKEKNIEISIDNPINKKK